MLLRALLVPAAVAAALALAVPAEAAPAPTSPVAFGGVHVGVGVGFPVGRPYRHHRGPDGYWTYRTQRVWIPERFIGYDTFGYAIYEPGYYELRRVRVWVPAPYRRVHRPRPRGFVSIGFGTR